MKVNIDNIFDFSGISFNPDSEYFEDIFLNDSFRIEKIYSSGQSTKEGEWLSEEVNEFVFLLEGSAEIKFKDNSVYSLVKGDYFLIPKNAEHRVEKTDKNNITTWLTIHFK